MGPWLHQVRNPSIFFLEMLERQEKSEAKSPRDSTTDRGAGRRKNVVIVDEQPQRQSGGGGCCGGGGGGS